MNWLYREILDQWFSLEHVYDETRTKVKIFIFYLRATGQPRREPPSFSFSTLLRCKQIALLVYFVKQPDAASVPL